MSRLIIAEHLKKKITDKFHEELDADRKLDARTVGICLGVIHNVIDEIAEDNDRECAYPPPLSLYGYDLSYLDAFAIACRRAGVSNDDLKEFVGNCRFAYDMVQKEIEESFKIVFKDSAIRMEGEI